MQNTAPATNIAPSRRRWSCHVALFLVAPLGVRPDAAAFSHPPPFVIEELPIHQLLGGLTSVHPMPQSTPTPAKHGEVSPVFDTLALTASLTLVGIALLDGFDEPEPRKRRAPEPVGVRYITGRIRESPHDMIEAEVLVCATLVAGSLSPEARRQPCLGYDAGPLGEASLAADIDMGVRALEQRRAGKAGPQPQRLSRGAVAALEIGLEAAIADSLGRREPLTLLSAVATVAGIKLHLVKNKSTQRAHVRRAREDLKQAAFRLERWPEFRDQSKAADGPSQLLVPAGRQLLDETLAWLSARAHARTAGSDGLYARREYLMFDLGLTDELDELDELELFQLLAKIRDGLWTTPTS